MRVEINNLLSSLSEALDCVEAEILGVKSNHSKRVAIMCIAMARLCKMSENEIAILVAHAVLHDNALNEYKKDYYDANGKPLAVVNGRSHCIAGEKNVENSLLFEGGKGFVLYHHERADGSGPMGKKPEETPLGAQLIHIADQVDRKFALDGHFKADTDAVRNFVQEHCNVWFAKNICNVFLSVLDSGLLEVMSDENIDLWQDKMNIKRIFVDLSNEQIYALAGLFARIIDFKSPFTQNHSLGIAQKAKKMAEYYGYDEELCAKMYFAGALHDIGKLAVSADILEKPGLLEDDEYVQIKSHAYRTYDILRKVEGLSWVTKVASHHHEKLDGKGYPFGKVADELDKEERLLACLDIYQALTEDRPYKAGMTHAKAFAILSEMVTKGELDGDIVADIDKVFRVEEKEIAENDLALFQCKMCGYIYESDTISRDFVCPVCAHPATAFERIL